MNEMSKRMNKYHAIKTTVDGITFDSRNELYNKLRDRISVRKLEICRLPVVASDRVQGRRLKHCRFRQKNCISA